MSKEPATEPSDRDPAAQESVELTVLARMAGVRTVHVRRYVEFGLLEAEKPRPTAQTPAARFNPTTAARVARAERLRRTSISITPAPCSSSSCSTESASLRRAFRSQVD